MEGIDLSFKPKIGIISCSGEDCAGGNISREATLKVLHNLKPNETVTICLPLFLVGDEGEREFARTFPTITVDGCKKFCAAYGTEHFSSSPAIKINVEDYHGDNPPKQDEKWKIKDSRALVDRVADDIAKHVDRLRNDWD